MSKSSKKVYFAKSEFLSMRDPHIVTILLNTSQDLKETSEKVYSLLQAYEQVKDKITLAHKN